MSSDRLQPNVQGHILIPLLTLLKQDTKTGVSTKENNAIMEKLIKQMGDSRGFGLLVLQ